MAKRRTRTTPPAQAKPAPVDFNELAASGDAEDITSGYVGELAQTRDEILRTRGGGNIAFYEAILRDDQVIACWQQRKRAAIAREWIVEPGGDTPLDQQAADFLKEQLERIGWDRVSNKMLSGIFYGYAVGECLWASDAGRIVLDAVKVRRPGRFRFDRQGSLRLMKQGVPNGEPMPERKFWTFTAGTEDDDDLYGRGLAYWLYWLVWFKRNGLKFWATHLERFASPTVVGSSPGGADDKQKGKFLGVLRAIGRDSAVVLPAGLEAKLLEAVRSSGGNFDVFVGMLNEAIAKVILSQTMTTENGGSLAQAKVQAEILADVVKGDNDLVCESFMQGPGTWLTEWNFPGAALPRLYRDHDQAEDMKARSERDTALHGMGYDPSPEYIEQWYGPGWTKRAATAPATVDAPISADFAEGDPAAGSRDAADDLADQLTVAAAGPLGDLVGGLGALLDEAADLEEFRRLLLEKGALLPVGALAHPIAQALAVADLTGRADLKDAQ